MKQFADAEALGRGQHRGEAVKLAVQPDGLGHLAAIPFESAVEVMQLDPGNLAHRPIEHPARRRFAERILAALFPPGDEIVAVVELFFVAAVVHAVTSSPEAAGPSSSGVRKVTSQREHS